MYPDPNNPSQNGQTNPQPTPQPDPHAPQPLPQYPSPYPPATGQQSWQNGQGQYQPAYTAPELPQPQRPGSVPAAPAATPYVPPVSASTTPSYAQSTPPATGGDNSKAKAVVVAIAVVVALLGLSVGAYFLMNAMNGSDKAPVATPEASQEEKKATQAAIASLQDVTLLPPSNLSRYTPNTENTELVMAYNTEGDGCSLQLGVVDANTLPGKDMKDIVERQIIALKDQGITVDGPRNAAALTLTDVADSSKQYTIPTMVFTATDATKKQVRSHYSAAVLKGGKRVYVMRTCQVANGAVDEATIKPLDDDAKRITVNIR